MNAHVPPQTLGDILAAALASRSSPLPEPLLKPKIAASRFGGLSKVGRKLDCMRCGSDAETIAVHSRGGMDIEHVECCGCGLRYRRVNP